MSASLVTVGTADGITENTRIFRGAVPMLSSS